MLLLSLSLALLSAHKVAANACGGVEGKYICNPNNPTLFDICIGDQKYTMSCPGGLHFNSRTQICDWPKSADCGKKRSKSPVRPRNNWSSSDSGYFRYKQLSPSHRPESDNNHWNSKDAERDMTMPDPGQGDLRQGTRDVRYRYNSQHSGNDVSQALQLNDGYNDPSSLSDVNSLNQNGNRGQENSAKRKRVLPRQNPYLTKGSRSEIQRREEILKRRYQNSRPRYQKSRPKYEKRQQRYQNTNPRYQTSQLRTENTNSRSQNANSRQVNDGYNRFSKKKISEGKAIRRWWDTEDVGNEDEEVTNIISQMVDDADDDYRKDKVDDMTDATSDDRFDLAGYPWWTRSTVPRTTQERFPAPTTRTSSRFSGRRQLTSAAASAGPRGSRPLGLKPSYPPVAAPIPRPVAPRSPAHRPPQQRTVVAANSITAAAASSPARKRKTKPRKTGKCSPATCKLPDCRCVGTDIPGNLAVEDTPQMVMLTFDDSVNIGNFDYFQKIFGNGQFRNPNGCPIKGTFYVSGDATQYHLVEKLYGQGQEIASHSMSHRSPTTYWAKAGYDGYVKEIEGMRKKLSKKCNIPREDIKGMRVPFLQVGGDDQYQMLEDYGFTYDTSMVTGHLYKNDNPPVWPFTLDYPPNSKTCSLTPCPTQSYPGLWEVPLIRWYGTNRLACAMPDSCTIGSGKRGTVRFLQDNFLRHYKINRSPLGIFLHASWFRRKHGNLEGLMDFLGNITQKKDVWVVTVSQVIDWMKDPVPNEKAGSFPSWSC